MYVDIRYSQHSNHGPCKNHQLHDENDINYKDHIYPSKFISLYQPKREPLVSSKSQQLKIYETRCAQCMRSETI